MSEGSQVGIGATLPIADESQSLEQGLHVPSLQDSGSYPPPLKILTGMQHDFLIVLGALAGKSSKSPWASNQEQFLPNYVRGPKWPEA